MMPVLDFYFERSRAISQKLVNAKPWDEAKLETAAQELELLARDLRSIKQRDPWVVVGEIFADQYFTRKIDARTLRQGREAICAHDAKRLLRVAGRHGFKEEIETVLSVVCRQRFLEVAAS